MRCMPPEVPAGLEPLGVERSQGANNPGRVILLLI